MPENTSEKQTPASQPPMIQAMVWYREEDWDTLKTLFADSHLLPSTYADWLGRAEEMKTRVQADGDIVIKVYIDPETFPAWCAQKGLPMDAEARSQLAIEMAQAQSFNL